MAEIILKHIYKEYQKGVQTVRDFNLEIKDKEFVIFVGPSGCGKSTTLRMIAGIEDITDGELIIDGQVVNDVEASERDIAMVFQNYALYPHMTVYDNIAYSLKLKKESKKVIKEKVDEVAKILGLETMLDRKPRELSGGQRQRVAMGRAIVRKPKAFLMDEPLSNLDAKLRNQMRFEIARLHKELDATMIYVTHDQVEAMTLGTKIVVLRGGDIMQVASPEVLYLKPANAFVAGFIGTPTMNFFDVICHPQGNEMCLKLDDNEFKLDKEVTELLRFNKYSNETIILGVRPEDIIINPENEEGIEAEVSVYELHGSDSVIYFDYKGQQISAKIENSRNIKSGSKIRFTFNMDNVHMFDKYSENRIGE